MTNLKNADLASKLFYVLAFGIFIAILMRNSALYPSIFADEYNDSTASRLLPLSQAPIANYLYLWTYRLTNVCGDGFLSCARILNTLFFILACPFIYQTAKRVCSKSIAKYIAILSIIGPINIYTANFMPEAMYFLAFWIFAWYTLGLNSDSSLKSWFGVGVLIGICMLIKPHGVFLLPPVLLYLFVLFKQKPPFETKQFIYAVAAMGFGALICKLIVGFLIAGVAGLSFLGHLYSATTQDFFNASSATTATNSISNTSELAGTLSAAKENSSFISKWASGLPALLAFWSINIRGHILGLCLLFGLPLLVGLRLLGAPLFESKTRSVQKDYAWFTFFLLAFLVLVSSLYSSLVTLSSSGEILRMHMRYYNFAFPLLLMMLPCIFSDPTENIFAKKVNFFEVTLWALVSVIVLWGIWKMMAPYQPTAIDMPELRGVMQNKWFFYTVTGFGLLCLLIWPIYRNISVKLFFWVVLPLLLIAGSIGVNQNIWQASKPNIYDSAGIVVKNLLSKDEISKLVVVGDNPIELSRVLFQLDQPEVAIQLIKGGATYDASLIPSGIKSILLMDSHSMASNIKNQIHFDGYTIAGGSGDIKIDFHNNAWPSKDLSYVMGFFVPPEPWGTWTIDKLAVLGFTKALPEEFTLKINARAFGPNIGKPIKLTMGDTTQVMTLTGQFQETIINIKNPQRGNRLEIDIPHPTSPKELKLGDDTRKLGIAISELKISW